jgi:vacuolar-type H+-ATPase subunit E/Vma4
MDVASVTATKPDAAALRSMGVRVRGTTDGTGGFLAYDADEKVGIDLRFDTILEHVRTSATGEIASVLFAREAPAKTKRRPPAKRKGRSR